ncbi:Cox11 cytochrome oxidase assembly protein [Candida orthopsilosis Co 90-125]|uniref:Cox11 cytochrome oxidase assembly protein n=1 Tax=Candida orthopsilosis (strain 90-125) TaxID=1136231 RepID=H8X7I1_CANO9|nr:Cox11 cytochrome oxidase assembly protein [Candida orthopsilosis Co 90-125]CCG23765.1 Cox11 cytochrome oxidase assembly protein [Candida orthopsilosis Co 90-125]
MIGVIRLHTASLRTMQMAKIRPCQSLPKLSLARSFHQSVIYKQLSQRQNQPQNEAKLEAERARLDKLTQEREERQRYKNRTATYYTASLGIVFLALAFCAVPVYRAICQRTGWGGIPITDSSRFTPDKLIPVDTNKRIRVQFTCQSSGVLPWKFTPLQREVYVVPGETALAFYRAKNMSKEDIIGMATYSIIPENAAAYFNKIQCFCFEEQRLSAGEEVDMPVFFFIDPDFAKDPNMRSIDDVVLHYSFFKAAYSDGELSAVPTGKLELKAEMVQ